MVEFYHPSIGGAQEVVRHLSERMVLQGHDVTVATTKIPERESTIHNGVKIIEFKISGNSVNGIKGESKKYKDFLVNSNFDIVMNYAAQQWTTDLFFEVIDKVSAKKVFVPCGFSALHDPAYSEYFNELPEILRKYDSTVYLSESYRDIDFARRNNVSNTTIIPNGADEKEFTKELSNERREFLRNKYALGGFTIMTIGLYGEKGHMDVLKIFKKLPVSKATFISVGSTRPEEVHYQEFSKEAALVNNRRKFLGKRIVMVDGSLRNDIKDLLKMSDVFVFLSNIECSPLVLFESAAAGIPFLATTAGNSAEIAKWTKGGIIVKSHSIHNSRVRADLKDALIKLSMLAHNRKKREQIGRAAHKIWLEKYTWDKITEKYLNLYMNILGDKR